MDDPEQKWITTWNDYLWRLKMFYRWIYNEDEFNKKRDLLDTIKNSYDYVSLKNKIQEQVNDFLSQKKDFFKLAAMTILNIIKQDPEKVL